MHRHTSHTAKQKKNGLSWQSLSFIIVSLVTIGGIRRGSYTKHIQRDTADRSSLRLSPSSSETRSAGFRTGDIRHITGILLTTYEDNPTRTDRSGPIFEPTPFRYGRLYDITLDEARSELQTLAHADTDIRLILEDRKYRQYGDPMEEREQIFSGFANVQISNDNHLDTRYVHAKTFVTDERFAIQTANLSYSSFFRNREHFFLSQDPEIRAFLQELFVRDRAGDEITSIHPNILICPHNCRLVIETLLTDAQHSILMQQQYLTDDSITDIIHGHLSTDPEMDIRMIFGDNEKNHGLRQRRGSDNVRIMTDPRPHSKTILIDDRYLILGSMNLSSNSLDNNREIGIILTNEDLREQWREGFEEDWREVAK